MRAVRDLRPRKGETVYQFERRKYNKIARELRKGFIIDLHKAEGTATTEEQERLRRVEVGAGGWMLGGGV